ncbi:MAG: hypothetical protein HYY65_03910, partial [Candidatus Tectomicrobia bacterium]|nr:hypothetical protein [Candidatus Tectomicrobia bacterium]
RGILTAILDVTKVKVAAAEAIFAVIGVLADERINLGTTLTLSADQGPRIDRNALPVILVPGLTGDPTSIANIRTQLSNTGVYRPLPVTSFPGLKNGVLTNAGLLGAEFSRVRSTILANFIPTSINLPVDAVGFSAGSILSRQFVSTLLGANPAGVGSLTQIGPPNHGSILVKNREAAEEVVRTQVPATVRLLFPGATRVAAEVSTWPFFTLEEAGRFPGASDLAPNTQVLTALNNSLPFSTLNRQFVIAGTKSLSRELDDIFKETNDGLVSRNSASLDGLGGPPITDIPRDHFQLPRDAQTVAEVPKHLSDWYVVTDVTPGTITPGQATTFTITIMHNFNREARSLVAGLFDANATQIVSTAKSIPNTGLNTTQMTLDITSIAIPATAPRPISLVVASDADIGGITTADLPTQTPGDAKMNLVRVGQSSRVGIFQRVVAGKLMLVAIGPTGAQLDYVIPGVEPEAITLKFRNVRDLTIQYTGVSANFTPLNLVDRIVLRGSQPEFQTIILQLDTLVDNFGRQAVNHDLDIVDGVDAGGFICIASISSSQSPNLIEFLLGSFGFQLRDCPE